MTETLFHKHVGPVLASIVMKHDIPIGDYDILRDAILEAIKDIDRDSSNKSNISAKFTMASKQIYC